MVLTSSFWFLDSYFLWQERLFRTLYDHVRTLKEPSESLGQHVYLMFCWAGFSRYAVPLRSAIFECGGSFRE